MLKYVFKIYKLLIYSKIKIFLYLSFDLISKKK